MTLFDWKPYVPAVIAAILCVNLWLQNSDLREELGALNQQIEHLESANEALTSSNRDLYNSLTLQNEAIQSLRSVAQEQQTAATYRADTVHQSLPRKIQKDLTAGSAPKEMNQWLDSLFSSH